jgi:AcrR family transcriptional regulator
MSHVERKQREKDNIRKNLLIAALEIAKAEGWEAVTIRRIAEAIEYTTSIVYGHFESKDALFNEIIEQGFKQLYDTSKKVLNKNDGPEKQLLAFRCQLGFAYDKQELDFSYVLLKMPSGNTSTLGRYYRKRIERLTGKSHEEIEKMFLTGYACVADVSPFYWFQRT